MLNAYNHQYTETQFLFSILCPCLGLGLFMLYLHALFFISSLILVVINHITSFKQTFFVNILEYFNLNIFYYFWMITWMKKSNNFQIVKVQPQGLLSFCLIFCKFQPGVAYKCVAYKKNVYIKRWLFQRTRGVHWISFLIQAMLLVSSLNLNILQLIFDVF